MNSLSKTQAYIHLMRLDKPIGIYLLLWPTLSALWLASAGFPSLKLFLIFTLGVILTRSAGCVINDYADIDFDKHVKRTENRPLTSGLISKKAALSLFVLLLILAFVLVLQTNSLTILLSFAAVFLMSLYPFMKRWFAAPQFFLGLAFSSAIPMAFAAQTNHIPFNSLWVMGFVISWAMAYDTMYAMADKKDDIKIGIKSTAILFAPYQRYWIIFFQTVMLLCLFQTAHVFALSPVFYLGLLISSIVMLYHHKTCQDGQSYFQAFRQNHWIGFSIFCVIILNYIG